MVVRTRSARPSATCFRSRSSSGRIPERRMNAMIRSIRSADAISAATWWPTAGSPGALVRSAESRSGISGASISFGLPSGLSRLTARRTFGGVPGV